MRRLPALALLLLTAVPACAARLPGECEDPTDPSCVGASADYLRIPGSFVPDDASLRAGSALVHYDDVPAWDGGAHCSGGITPGGRRLSSYLRAHFSGISSIGGYSCRPNTANTSRMSVHGSGRALDIMIPLDHGDADNGVGDPIANWLIANSTTIGIQYLAWDRTQWSGSRTSGRVRPYTGPIPHIDHIHAELTIDASLERTPFFGGSSTTAPTPTPTPTPTPALDARFVAQGSDARADTTGAAQLTACAGDPVTFWFEVENVGSATWVDDGAASTGHAVRLGVPTDTPDPLVGSGRVSLDRASNTRVVPTGGACTDVGCRRTRFTMTGLVPTAPGIHRTTWRMVDETRAWFGPEMWLSFRVEDCAPPPPPSPVDDDHDIVAAENDCDDHDPDRFPGHREVCADGIDQDCDGIDPACLTPALPTYDPDIDDPGFDWAGGEPVYTPRSGSRLLSSGGCSASPVRGGSMLGFGVVLAALVIGRRRARS